MVLHESESPVREAETFGDPLPEPDGLRGSVAIETEHDAELLALDRQCHPGAGVRENMPDLEEPDRGVANRRVLAQAAEQPRQKARAQGGFLAHDRVDELDRRGARAELPLVARVDDRARPGLVGAVAGDEAGQPPAVGLVRREQSHAGGTLPGRRDVLVAEVPGDLLDHVDLPLGVGAERRHHDFEHTRRLELGPEPDRLEIPRDLSVRQLAAEQRVHPRATNTYASRLGHLPSHVEGPAGHCHGVARADR